MNAKKTIEAPYHDPDIWHDKGTCEQCDSRDESARIRHTSKNYLTVREVMEELGERLLRSDFNAREHRELGDSKSYNAGYSDGHHTALQDLFQWINQLTRKAKE